MKIFWDMNTLISSYWGMYAIQTVLHSVIAALFVHCALLAWDVRMPAVRQRFRFMAIYLPLCLFPLYQFIAPHRGDVYFRIHSLLDSSTWFFLDWHGIPAFTVFAVLLGLSAIIFIVQELVPIVFSMLEQMRAISGPGPGPLEEDLKRKVSEALAGLPIDEQFVEIVHDEDLSLFSDTGMNPRIYVSTGLITAFSVDQLEAAFAHELGHIQRTRRPVLILAYLLRAVMFYNPIALFEFRKIAQEEEKVCDDIAVSLTNKPVPLSEAVEMLRPEPEDIDPGNGRKGIRGLVSTLEHHSHDALLQSRIMRIGTRRWTDVPWGVPYCITAGLIAGINFFVV
jgi:Zn-dependent protease with chaperone function